jgi:hypothetical protein
MSVLLASLFVSITLYILYRALYTISRACLFSTKKMIGLAPVTFDDAQEAWSQDGRSCGGALFVFFIQHLYTSVPPDSCVARFVVPAILGLDCRPFEWLIRLQFASRLSQ